LLATRRRLLPVRRLLGGWALAFAGLPAVTVIALRLRAGELYRRAAELAPESDELLFWAGLSQAHAGDLDGGAQTVRRAAELNPAWLLLLERLSPELAPGAAAVRERLGS
jgi:hypothetical protein